MEGRYRTSDKKHWRPVGNPSSGLSAALCCLHNIVCSDGIDKDRQPSVDIIL
jgi:hypothetical protein